MAFAENDRREFSLVSLGESPSCRILILGDDGGMKSPLFPTREQRGQPAEVCKAKSYNKQFTRVPSVAYPMLPSLTVASREQPH